MTTWLSPGDPRRRTGGFIYNAHIIDARDDNVLALPGQWPSPSEADTRRCGTLLSTIPDGEVVILDGLALVGALPWLPALRARTTVILLIHLPLSAERGTPPTEAARLHALEAQAVALSHRVVATSAHAAAQIATLHGCEVRAISPGCTPPPPAQVSGAGRLLCVGSIAPRKGHDILLAALSQLTDLDWRLRCAGEVGAWAETLRISERVTLLGPLDQAEMDVEYASADIFTLATWDETYGMALAEAAAAGLPIVSTTAGAVPQTVPPGAGLLVPPGDVDALAGALRVVLTDPVCRSVMARASRAAPVRSWGEVVDDWDTLEEELR
jgi:glycosyltransferase involved in cell wall biosynthesis